MHSSETTKQLQQVIDFVWDNTESDFYRRFWNKHGITQKPVLHDLSDFEKLPIIERKDFEQAPHPDTRCHMPKTDTLILSSTSGSTSNNPLFFWRNDFHDTYYDELSRGHTANMLYVMNYHRSFCFVAGTKKSGVQTIAVDPHRLRDAAALIETGNIDMLSMTQSNVDALTNLIQDPAAFAHIKVISLWGEACTPLVLRRIQKHFPNASICIEFGLTELSCSNALTSTDECEEAHRKLHVNTKYIHVEVVGGELTLTTLGHPLAFPLIRYRTGDSVTWADSPCSCTNSAPRVELSGRSGVDFVRIGGFEVRIQLVDEALEEFSQYLEPFLDVRIRHREVDDSVTAAFVLTVQKKPGVHMLDSYLAAQMCSALKRRLMVSNGITFGEAIRMGAFCEPEIQFTRGTAARLKNKSVRLEQGE